MELTRVENEMLDGRHGPAKQRAMAGLVQLGRAFGAPRMVEIGYAHIHAGMALYLEDVELMEELADIGAAMAVPASVNIANADTVNWQQTGAPEKLVRLQQRATTAHHKMGSACTYTCTPYWAGHWPTWNTHMTSIESTVTVFCNSVLGAKSNRDGFFAVYAGMTGRYPLFGYHVDANRRGTQLFRVDTPLDGTTDYSCLGFHVGRIVGEGVPVFTGLPARPNLDELDALGAALATSGGVALFIVPGVTPPFADVAQAFGGGAVPEAITVRRPDVDAVYDYFCTGTAASFDIVHVGCPHASFEEMKHYAALLRDKRVHGGVEFWITTSRAVRGMAEEAGLLRVLEAAGAKVISDTCPISCHFARTTSPDPKLGVVPPPIRTVVIDSAKQAKYVRDMIRCDTLLTGTREAVDTAVTGQFVARRA
jgi:phosphomecalonate degydratase large subunit